MKGQYDFRAIITLLFFIFVGLIFSSLILRIVNSGCEDEIQQRDTCYQERDQLLNQTKVLTDEVNNCSNQILKEKISCDQKIHNAIAGSQNITLVDDSVLLTYVFITFAFFFTLILSITLTFVNLEFRINLPPKFEKFNKALGITYLIIRIIFLIVSGIVLYETLMYL